MSCVTKENLVPTNILHFIEDMNSLQILGMLTPLDIKIDSIMYNVGDVISLDT